MLDIIPSHTRVSTSCGGLKDEPADSWGYDDVQFYRSRRDCLADQIGGRSWQGCKVQPGAILTLTDRHNGRTWRYRLADATPALVYGPSPAYIYLGTRKGY